LGGNFYIQLGATAMAITQRINKMVGGWGLLASNNSNNSNKQNATKQAGDSLMGLTGKKCKREDLCRRKLLA